VKFIRLDDDTRTTVERLSLNREEPESAFEEGARREGVALSSVPPPPSISLPSIPPRNEDSQAKAALTLPTRPSVTAANAPPSPADKKPSRTASAPPLAQKSAGLGVVRIPQISSGPQPQLPSMHPRPQVRDEIDDMIDAAISPSRKSSEIKKADDE